MYSLLQHAQLRDLLLAEGPSLLAAGLVARRDAVAAQGILETWLEAGCPGG